MSLDPNRRRTGVADRSPVGSRDSQANVGDLPIIYPAAITTVVIRPLIPTEYPMFDRLSANALLKSVIAVMAVTVTLLLAASAWDAWRQLTTASRLAALAEVSGHAFRAMHNLRVDRSQTGRYLNAAGPTEAEAKRPLEKARESERPALQSALAALANVEFRERDEMQRSLQRAIDRLFALHGESADAMNKPKTARREQLAQEFLTEINGLLDLLDKLSKHLTAAAKFRDPVVDHLLLVKELAWTVRNTGGDASVIVSNGLNAGNKLPAEAMQQYATHMTRASAAWATLEDMMTGTTPPARLAEAVKTAKASFFAQDFSAQRERMIKAMIAGESTGMTMLQWVGISLERLNTLLSVAERALDAAKEHAATQRAEAQRGLIVQLVLLAIAIGLAFGSMIAVSSRVVRPLHAIQDAMMKVAEGDLTAEVPFADRRDEIGALAGALGTFKQNAVEKARIEEEQRERHAQAAARQQAVEGHISAFEGQMRKALEALSGASTEMRATSDGMSTTAEQTNQQVKTAASASDDASTNVQTVAAASEELSKSVAEISQQVARAASIASRAVEETRQTDSTVQSLAETAG
ncbi:MAG: methyl-accepting chemotaxis protein, partial [Proteobacteria bacterium]|nr:methyl-accepting chemotaxis protein [Pseudomonadota bacterium]